MRTRMDRSPHRRRSVLSKRDRESTRPRRRDATTSSSPLVSPPHAARSPARTMRAPYPPRPLPHAADGDDTRRRWRGDVCGASSSTCLRASPRRLLRTSCRRSSRRAARAAPSSACGATARPRATVWVGARDGMGWGGGARPRAARLFGWRWLRHDASALSCVSHVSSGGSDSGRTLSSPARLSPHRPPPLPEPIRRCVALSSRRTSIHRAAVPPAVGPRRRAHVVTASRSASPLRRGTAPPPCPRPRCLRPSGT